MKTYNCICCETNKADDVYSFFSDIFSGEKTKYTILQCKKCGLGYVIPQPSSEEIKTLYVEEYQLFTKDNEKSGKRRKERWHEEGKKIEYIEKYKYKGKILEVGPGFGVFMEVAKNNGWDVFGVELNKYYYNYLKNDLKLNVINSTLKEADYEENFFDVINMDNVLEHMATPKEELAIGYKILKKGGVILVQVPNFDNLLYKIVRIYREIFRKTETEFFHHLYFFNKKSLNILMIKCGYKIISTRTRKSMQPIEINGIKSLFQFIIKSIGNIIPENGDILSIIAMK